MTGSQSCSASFLSGGLQDAHKRSTGLHARPLRFIAAPSDRPLGRNVTARKLSCSGWGGGGSNNVAEGQPLVSSETTGPHLPAHSGYGDDHSLSSTGNTKGGGERGLCPASVWEGGLAFHVGPRRPHSDPRTPLGRRTALGRERRLRLSTSCAPPALRGVLSQPESGGPLARAAHSNRNRYSEQ